MTELRLPQKFSAYLTTLSLGAFNDNFFQNAPATVCIADLSI